jgi:hypothetical protein
MRKPRHYADLKSPMCVITLVAAIVLWMFTAALANPPRDPGEEPEYYPVVKIGGDVQQAANKPSNAIDGNPLTRWSAAWKNDAPSPVLILDLGVGQYVNFVEITWHDGASREYYFSIQIFGADHGFTPVGGGSSQYLDVVEYPLVISTHARIIRIEGYGSDHPRAKTAEWTSIAEIRVGYDTAYDDQNPFCW